MSKIVIIKGAKKHFLLRLIAAFIYTYMLYLFIMFFIDTPIITAEKYIISFLHLIKGEVYLVTLALLASVVTHHHFNLKDNLYRKYFSMGPLGYGKWIKINELNYTSVNLNSNDIYEVIIWDKSNNRFKVYFYKKEAIAIENAKKLAEQLYIKFYG